MVPPMRRLLLMLLVPLFGCPAPEPIDCTRNLIDVSGFANGGFGGGFGGAGGSTGTGGSSGAPEDPVGLVGKPARFTVFAPLSACDPDVLRADVTLVDPDNEPVEFNVDGAIARSGEQHAVSGTFSFTPLKPGVHILRVSFEPSLGVRSVLFDVASDGLVNPTTRVPIPAGANCTVWPLTDDTVACEERGGFVSITSVDGGLTRFPGAELVVADNVLWSIDGTSSTLERRIYEDGGVRVTHRFPSFPLMPTPGLHEADLALRYRSNRLITRVRISRGVASLGDFAVDPFISPPLAYFIEPDDTLYRASSSDCFSTPCTNLPDLVGLEPGLVWRTINGFDFNSAMKAFERPLRTPPHARLSLNRAPWMGRGFPAHAFERIPLWLSLGVDDRHFLVSTEPGAASYSAWPFSEVLQVGSRHLVLTDSPGFVRVVKK